MDRSATTTTSEFVRWEEVYVTSDRGRREIHYYLKRKDGTSDLAVIGKEKSLRHMSYHFVIREDRSLFPVSYSSSLLKLRSRREVIDWLNSIVPGLHPPLTSQSIGGSLNSQDVCELDEEIPKDVQLGKLGQYPTEFIWLGSQWTCRKRRRHYQSFRRNGVKISVNDFVYVLAEEDKRLVAYLDDMYEDSRGNKMVVVQWFHKIDEVGIALPHNYNDREIFFSFCLQDLGIECIDGLATILSLQHYEKFFKEAAHTQLEPFLCHRQFDNDDVKSFDLTQVKGYWNQDILRYMSTRSPSKFRASIDSLQGGGHCSDAVRTRPNKRLCLSKDYGINLHSADKQVIVDALLDIQDLNDFSVGPKSGGEMCSLKDGCSPAYISGKEEITQKHPPYLTIGSQVEVLSQDSGIRGCWFRAQIIKNSRDNVKVQYQDLKDAADEANNLKEWVLASRVAVPDELGLRICGRPTVRPTPLSNKGKFSGGVNVGIVVDVWWHDGWWEGIVVQKESENKLHVYFPGENRESIFSRSDLRQAQEWFGDGWKHIKERPELVTSVLSGLGLKQSMIASCDDKLDQATLCSNIELVCIVHKDGFLVKDEFRCGDSRVHSGECIVKESEVVRDLSKDDLLAQLKWKSSRKRKRDRSSAQRVLYSVIKNKNSPEALGKRIYERVFIPSSLKIDNDNCKYIGDYLLSSSVVSPLTSLVYV